MARRACEKYIRLLSDIGQCPIELIESILIKVDNPDQLRKLEENSPQVVGHTKDAWIHLLRRDIPNFEKYMPDDWEASLFDISNAERWHKIYRKLKRTHDEEQKAHEAKLAATLKGMRNDREKTTAQVTSKKLIVQPTNRFVAARYNMNKDMFASRNAPNSSFFDKLNRNAVTKSSARMKTPTHKLKPFNTTKPITKAPMSLVEELRAKKDALPAASADAHRAMPSKITRVQVPKGPLHRPQTGAAPYDLMQDREARLRSLKSGQAAASDMTSGSSRARDTARTAQLTEDFLEDDDDDNGSDNGRDHNDDDELFREEPIAKASPARNSPAPSMTHKHIPSPVRREKKATSQLFRPTSRR
ncbi:hypothetical protein H2198_003806 [Neophaeococcomyces mojaviensis]|uniref:Uncharacterized protein n=1 Tax=Neophaeococcomyces mojaviensis TaxID=3383035 RepID=A0ACC3AA87_9EURO|nr:hypothetical protein H2198_003806 [Knufia sp. JES_112]